MTEKELLQKLPQTIQKEYEAYSERIPYILSSKRKENVVSQNLYCETCADKKYGKSKKYTIVSFAYYYGENIYSDSTPRCKSCDKQLYSKLTKEACIDEQEHYRENPIDEEIVALLYTINNFMDDTKLVNTVIQMVTSKQEELLC